MGKFHTKTKDEIAIENIEALKSILLKELKNYDDKVLTQEEYVEIVMHHFLIFTLGGCEEKILHRYAWDYFANNKEYLLTQIP